MGTFIVFKVAFQEQTIGETQAFGSFSKFNSSVTSVDAGHLGYPLTSKTDENLDWLEELYLEGRRITTCEIWHVNFILVSLEHFERQSECASDCWQIYALPAE